MICRDTVPRCIDVPIYRRIEGAARAPLWKSRGELILFSMRSHLIRREGGEEPVWKERARVPAGLVVVDVFINSLAMEVSGHESSPFQHVRPVGVGSVLSMPIGSYRWRAWKSRPAACYWSVVAKPARRGDCS